MLCQGSFEPFHRDYQSNVISVSNHAGGLIAGIAIPQPCERRAVLGSATTRNTRTKKPQTQHRSAASLCWRLETSEGLALLSRV